MRLLSNITPFFIGKAASELFSSTLAMKRSSCKVFIHQQRWISSSLKRNLTSIESSKLVAFQNTRINPFTKLTKSKTVYRSPWPLQVSKRKKNTLTYADVMNMDDGQLDPMAIANGTIAMPKALSPSAAAEFKNCPQSFFFQYILSIKQPPNLALAKGSMCHSALEQIFDLEPRERSLEHLQNLFRKNWSEVRLSDKYGPLFEKPNSEFKYERDIDAEREWGKEALSLLSNYYQLEDPRLIPKPNPLERETWVTAHLTLDPTKGATAAHDTAKSLGDEETFFMRGIVDRIDYVAVPPSPHNIEQVDQLGAVRIVDYKTGKAPNFKYSSATNERIAEDNLWQLKIYALLLVEMIKNNKAYSKSGNLQKISIEDIRLLRLTYLTSIDGDARYLDMDLGRTQDERNEVLHRVHQELAEIWKTIGDLVHLQDPKAFKHCDREWCFCHKIRPKFKVDTLNQ